MNFLRKKLENRECSNLTKTKAAFTGGFFITGLGLVRGKRLKIKAGKMLGYYKQLYGYRLNEKRTMLVIYELEAKIVRLIFEWYTMGDKSMVTIAKELDKKITKDRIR